MMTAIVIAVVMPVVQGNVKTVHAIKRHSEKSIQVCLHTK